MKFLSILFVVLFVVICSITIFDKITKSKHDELVGILLIPMVFVGFWAVYCVIVP